jgi:hypothetical protein
MFSPTDREKSVGPADRRDLTANSWNRARGRRGRRRARLVRVVEAEREVEERRLRAGLADQGHDPAGADVQVDA